MPLACVPILHRWEEDGRHWLLIRRRLDNPQEKAYSFVFAPPGTSLPVMVKAIGAGFHSEEDFETSKEMGLDHYQVRSWIGWYRQLTLVMLAHALTLRQVCPGSDDHGSTPPHPCHCPAFAAPERQTPCFPSRFPKRAICWDSSSGRLLGV